MKSLFRPVSAKTRTRSKTDLLVIAIAVLIICTGMIGVQFCDFKSPVEFKPSSQVTTNGVPETLAMYSGGETAQTYQLYPSVFEGDTVRWTISSDPFVPEENSVIDALSVFPSAHGSASISQNGTITAGKSSEVSVITAKTDTGNFIASCTVRFYNASQVNARLNELNYRGEDGNALPTHDEVTEPSFFALAKFKARMGLQESDSLSVDVMCALFEQEALANNQAAESVVIKPSPATVTHHFTRKLTVQVYPFDALDKSVSWTSSNTSVATVSSDGTVTGVSAGTVTITATAANGVSGTCTLTVAPLNVTAISMSRSSMDIAAGTSQTLTASIIPSNATNPSVTWTSSNTNVATVNANGVVTGVGVGMATITATALEETDIKASCEVTVGKQITGLSFASTSVSITEGQALNLTPTITPQDAIIKTLTWMSSNPSIATVNANGCVVAKVAGSTVITVKTNDGTNKTASCTVTVKYTALTNLYAYERQTDDPRALRLFIGETQTNPFRLEFKPANATYKTARWYCSDPSILNVDVSTGNLTAIKAGKVQVWAEVPQGTHATVSSKSNYTKRYVTVYNKSSFGSSATVNAASADNHKKAKAAALSNKREYFVQMALSQVGYQNGMSDGTNVYFHLNECGGWSKYGMLERPTMYQPYGEYHWCAAFVNWCARKSGATEIAHGASARLNSDKSFVPVSYTEVTSNGPVTVYSTPARGDLVYFGTRISGSIYSASSYKFTHIGIVTSYDSATKTVYTVEGNTANGTKYGVVAKKSHKLDEKNNIIGYSRTQF